MSKAERPRMSDIAREANVNRITVSRALSQPELLAPETLTRVRAAIAKLGYIPDQIARGMKTGHSRIVSLVTPPHMSGVYGTILEQLSQELFRSGFIVNLFPVHEVAGHQEAVLRELAGWRPAAIVTFGFQLSADARTTLHNARVPQIELLTYSETGPGSCVGYDQRAAARLLTEHLLDQGYRKIVYAHASRRGSMVTSERLGGFVDGIAARGGALHLRAPDGTGGGMDPATQALPNDAVSGIEVRAEAAFHEGYGLMQQLAAWPVRPDAILFASDLVAVGALQYCVAHGLRLRRDIALCAFDGIEITTIMQPHLTSLDFPLAKVISEGARQILRLAEDQSTRAERIRLDVRVIHREST